MGFDCSTVKQEIARLGILPFPAFWAKSNRYGAPGPALLLHFIFSTIFIAATPLRNANGYVIFSTIYYYDRALLAGTLIFMLYLSRESVIDGQSRSRYRAALGPATGVIQVRGDEVDSTG